MFFFSGEQARRGCGPLREPVSPPAKEPPSRNFLPSETFSGVFFLGRAGAVGRSRGCGPLREPVSPPANEPPSRNFLPSETFSGVFSGEQGAVGRFGGCGSPRFASASPRPTFFTVFVGAAEAGPDCAGISFGGCADRGHTEYVVFYPETNLFWGVCWSRVCHRLSSPWPKGEKRPRRPRALCVPPCAVPAAGRVAAWPLCPSPSANETKRRLGDAASSARWGRPEGVRRLGRFAGCAEGTAPHSPKAKGERGE